MIRERNRNDVGLEENHGQYFDVKVENGQEVKKGESSF